MEIYRKKQAVLDVNLNRIKIMQKDSNVKREYLELITDNEFFKIVSMSYDSSHLTMPSRSTVTLKMS